MFRLFRRRQLKTPNFQHECDSTRFTSNASTMVITVPLASFATRWRPSCASKQDRLPGWRRRGPLWNGSSSPRWRQVEDRLHEEVNEFHNFHASSHMSEACLGYRGNRGVTRSACRSTGTMGLFPVVSVQPTHPFVGFRKNRSSLQPDSNQAPVCEKPILAASDIS